MIAEALDAMLAFAREARLYPPHGEPGITYFEDRVGGIFTVDCLLYRDTAGELVGLFEHYPLGLPPFEREKAIALHVRPDHQRQGVATRLLEEALRRWPLDLDHQAWRGAGRLFYTTWKARHP
jgi:GNAT superfamily N-acetyltransferase